MAEIQSRIEARMEQILAALNGADLERYAGYHTEGCTLMYQDEPTYTGRQALIDRMKRLFAKLSVTKSVRDALDYFEALDDNTVYTTYFINSLDQAGGVVARFRLTSIWKKEGNEWFVDRKFMNLREFTKRDEAYKEIEAQMVILYDAFSRMDIEGALKIYADEPTWLFQGQENIKGKKDGYEGFMKLIPAMKTLIMDEIFYFELFGDDTAVTNAYVDLVDEHGKPFNRIRDFFLWKKKDGLWRIYRDSYNELPLK